MPKWSGMGPKDFSFYKVSILFSCKLTGNHNLRNGNPRTKSRLMGFENCPKRCYGQLPLNIVNLQLYYDETLYIKQQSVPKFNRRVMEYT